ncbi:MAG TPA: glycosyltransferase family 2 protein [Candidatus Acidoferrales bacterium]|nr:glycosyltransferase family 2 protein [Candidatus Acidoferrales bacterium]
MAERAALIIPALNEEETIAAALDGLAGQALAQVVVVDNGSSDHTAEVARRCGAQVVSEPRRGYGQACLAGVAALEPDTGIVVFMDADGSDDPADLERLLEPIRRGEADFVVGSRSLGERERDALSRQQRLGNRLASILLRVFYGAHYTDLGPFRAIPRDALEKLSMRDTNFGWTVEMQIKARRHGLRVREVPVRYRRRRGGRSKVSGSVRGSILAGAKILWTILRYRFSG